MIRIEARRLDAKNRFLFQIHASGSALVTVEDPVEAFEILLRLGVGNPQRVIEHVRQWGVIEVHTK